MYKRRMLTYRLFWILFKALTAITYAIIATLIWYAPNFWTVTLYIILAIIFTMSAKDILQLEIKIEEEVKKYN